MKKTIFLKCLFLSLLGSISLLAQDSSRLQTEQLALAPVQKMEDGRLEIAVTATDYCAFLNTIASTDFTGTYNEKMDSLVRSGSPGHYTYAVVSGEEGKRMSFVDGISAMSFSHWKEQGEGFNVQSSTSTSTLNFNSCKAAYDQELSSNHILFDGVNDSGRVALTQKNSGGASKDTGWKKFVEETSILGVVLAGGEEGGEEAPVSTRNQIPNVIPNAKSGSRNTEGVTPVLEQKARGNIKTKLTAEVALKTHQERKTALDAFKEMQKSSGSKGLGSLNSLEESNKYLKKLIQDNIYEECLAEVAKLSLTKRQTAEGKLKLAQEEQEEWNVAKAAAEFSKRKAQANLIRAQRNTVEARANLDEAKQNAKDTARAPKQGNNLDQALTTVSIAYEKARSAYAASDYEAKRLEEMLAETKVEVADAVLYAINVRNTSSQADAEAELKTLKETEVNAAADAETAKADVSAKIVLLNAAEQKFNAAKRAANQAPKQSQQRNNDILQAAAKAAKIEAELSDARALLARTETVWVNIQESFKKTSDVYAKEKVAQDAENAAIERSKAAQKVVQLSEALRDISIAETDFATAAKIAAKDTLHATTALQDVTAARGVFTRAKAEREAADNKRAADKRAADNKRADDERAAKAKAEKEAADRNRADVLAKENVETAFNNAIRTKTEAAWVAAKNIATTAYNASRENKTLFDEKKEIAVNKVAFFQVKRLFISCMRNVKDIFTNMPKHRLYYEQERNNPHKGFGRIFFDNPYDDLRRYLYEIDINSNAYKEAKKHGFHSFCGVSNCYSGFPSVFKHYYPTNKAVNEAVNRALYYATKAMEDSVDLVFFVAFAEDKLSDYSRKERKNNIEVLKSFSTDTAGTIWEEEVQWLFMSAKEVVNESEAAIAKVNACNIM